VSNAIHSLVKRQEPAGFDVVEYCTAQIAKGLSATNQEAFFDTCYSKALSQLGTKGATNLLDMSKVESYLTEVGNCFNTCQDANCLHSCLTTADLPPSTEGTSLAQLTYYSQSQINARHTQCLNTCHTGDADCMFYCNSKITDDTSISIDIQMGDKAPGR
jgi:hypothetical protein